MKISKRKYREMKGRNQKRNVEERRSRGGESGDDGGEGRNQNFKREGSDKMEVKKDKRNEKSKKKRQGEEEDITEGSHGPNERFGT
jgi:hypothetical protein